MGQIRVHRRAAGDGEVGIAAEHRANLLVDNGVIERMAHAQACGNSVAGLLGLAPFACHAYAAGEHAAGETSACTLGGGVVHLFEYARDGEQQSGTEVLEVLDDRLHIAGEAESECAGKGHRGHESCEHMGKREEQQQAAVGDVYCARHVL